MSSSIRGLFSLLGLLACAVLFGQASEKEVDQWRETAATSNNEDLRYNASFELGNHYKYYDRDSSFLFLDQARLIAEDQNDAKKRIQVYQALGVVADYANEKEESMSWLLNARELVDQTDLDTLKMKVYNSLGVLTLKNGDYDKAMEFYLKAYDAVQAINDSLLLYNVVVNIGHVHFYQKRYDDAEAKYLSSLDIAFDLVNTSLMAGSYGHLGLIASVEGDMEEGIRLNLLAAKVLEGDPKTKPDLRANTYQNLAMAYKNAGQFLLAKENYAKSKTIFEEIDDQIGIAQTYVNMAELNMSLNQNKKAEKSLKEAEKIVVDLNNKEGKMYVFESFFDLYKKNENHKLALSYYLKKKEIEDSLYTIQSANKIASLEEKFQAKSKVYNEAQEKLRLANVEKAQVEKASGLRMLSLGTIAFVLILGTLAIAFRYFKNSKKLSKEKEEKDRYAQLLINWQELERKRVGSEIREGVVHKLLQLQHDLKVLKKEVGWNKEMSETVSTIGAVTGDIKQELDNIAYVLRPYHLEIDGLANSIQKLYSREKKSLDLNVNLELKLRSNEYPKNIDLHIYRMVQDAFHHFSERQGATFGSIRIQENTENIVIEIVDDGESIDHQKTFITVQNAGLQSIQDRARFLNGEIQIESRRGAGFSMKIVLPVDEESENQSAVSPHLN